MGSAETLVFNNSSFNIIPDPNPNSEPHSNSDSDLGARIIAEHLMPWIQEHMPLIVGVGLLLLFLLIVTTLGFTWLSSRAQFMVLDGVVRNRGAISEPWRTYRREGNSLFRFRVWFGLFSLLGLAWIFAVPVLVGMVDLHPSLWAPRTIAVSLYCGISLLVWLVGIGVVSMLLTDFVVPIMILHRIPVLQAWKHAIQHLLIDHAGSIALYFLVRLMLNTATAVFAIIITLLTCCLSLVPYVGSVILLPLTIFRVTYPLAFLEQLGPEWQIFPPERQTSL